ncbi:hypothetical protein KIW84_015912 [Lathyrus oleraceus]|uniref:GST N-terminal domain-containing protein n=1 Tax=Pisum sativum TaxID=3888 RepID=A0A9D5BS20_PEA|nr:hypothetical protein KIW84_015912 [Pisum sativum]
MFLPSITVSTISFLISPIEMLLNYLVPIVSDIKPDLRAFPFKSMALILHSTQANRNFYKILIAAEYVGVKVELAPDFQMGVSNKTPHFLKLNPIGKVPVLETPEGAVFESNAIARHVARLGENNLFGSSSIGHVCVLFMVYLACLF